MIKFILLTLDYRLTEKKGITTMKPNRQSQEMSEAPGFRIITVGTGTPTIEKERICPSTLIQYKDKFFPVDMGTGALRSMTAMGLSPGAIKQVLFTHLHSDHSLDYGALLISGWHHGRKALTTVGPKGIEKIYRLYMEMYEKDIAYRVELNSSDEGILSNMEFREVAGGEVFELDGLKISTLFVPHTAYTVAYKFEADGKCVVVTGDMTYSPDMAEFAKNADVMVMDANMADLVGHAPGGPGPGGPGGRPGTPGSPGGPNPKKFLEVILKSHATMEQVAQMAHEAQAKSIILTHMTVHCPVVKAVAAVGEIYKGNIFAAYDGMTLDVP